MIQPIYQQSKQGSSQGIQPIYGKTSTYQYKAPSPTPTAKPTSVPKASPTPPTKVQQSVNTAGSIIKKISDAITFTFTKPKIISPVPGITPLTSQPMPPKKPVSLKPDQKFLSGDQLKKAFPQTAQAVADFKSPGKTDIKKAASDAWTVIKDAFTEGAKRTAERNFSKSTTQAEKVSKELKYYSGVANAALSPVSALFAALNNSNARGVTKAIAVPFVLAAEGASKTSDAVIDALPLDKKTKETIKPAFAEVSALAAQFALGEFVHIGTKKAKGTISKVGGETFEKFTKNVIEESGSPRTVNITKDQARNILRDLGDKQTVDLFKTLEIKQRIQAVKDGITLEIPAEKIVRIVDKPYWEKVKSFFNVKPTDVTNVSVGTPTTKSTFAGFLETGEKTPQQIIDTVMGSGLEKTAEAKAMLQAALEAKESGQNIIVSKEADTSLLKSEMAQEEAVKTTPQSEKVVKELDQKQRAIEQAKEENQVKKSILQQFDTNTIRAMRAIKRSVAVLEKKGLDPTNVSTTESYKTYIENVMEAIGTNSEDVALTYIREELPDALTSASTRQELEEIKVLKSRIEPKEIPVNRSQLPVGEGAPKVSRLEARMKGVMDKVTPQQIEELGLSTFNTMNRKETIAKAAEYIINNQKEALDVLRGSVQPPEGIPPEAIYVALTQQAKGDLTLATKLASLQATAIGQRLSLLAELDPNSPVKLLNQVYNVREEKFKKRYAGKTVKEVKEKIVKKAMERAKKPDKYDINKLIDLIETC